MDSWGKFSWYIGYGGEYYINRLMNFGFSMGIMNKKLFGDRRDNYTLHISLCGVTHY